tara:strand:+ start:495 stop:809 length:315 start_codon:yes stop_codon:yes gene_type:complete
MTTNETLKALRDRAAVNRNDYLGIARDQEFGQAYYRSAKKCDEEIAALTEAMQAVDKVAAIRERVEELRPYDHHERYDSVSIEITESIKSDLIGFIDSLYKVES